MKLKVLVPCIGLALLLVFGTTAAQAQVANPLGLGALGAALGFLAGGNAAGAAIGGAAGVGAGILLNASQASAGYGYYGPGYYGPRTYGPPVGGYVYRSGYYARPWYPHRHCTSGYYYPRRIQVLSHPVDSLCKKAGACDPAIHPSRRRPPPTAASPGEGCFVSIAGGGQQELWKPGRRQRPAPALPQGFDRPRF